MAKFIHYFTLPKLHITAVGKLTAPLILMLVVILPHAECVTAPGSIIKTDTPLNRETLTTEAQSKIDVISTQWQYDKYVSELFSKLSVPSLNLDVDTNSSSENVSDDDNETTDIDDSMNMNMNMNATTGFVWGLNVGNPATVYSWQTNWSYEERLTQLISDLNAINVSWVRIDVTWFEIEPYIYNHTLVAEVTNEIVDAYIASKNWSKFDTCVSMLTAAGINIVFILGCGYIHNLPYIANTAERISPDTVGWDYYLGDIYLYARAVVRRYGGDVQYWQIENELNAAGPTALLFGWRTLDLAWWHPVFLETLIATLASAVKIEANLSGYDMYTIHNFHTDVPGWSYYLTAWLDYLDIVGIDSYPNYLFGWPVLGETLGLKVELASILATYYDNTTESWVTKPVWVIETGYPTAPAERAFNELRQAEYVESAALSALAAGADGFFIFTITSSEEVIYPWWEPQSVEAHWGLIKPEFVYTDAWYVYGEIIASNP
jgi:hypothetical protein